MTSVAVLGLLMLAAATDESAVKSHVAIGGRYTIFGSPPLAIYSIIPDPDEAALAETMPDVERRTEVMFMGSLSGRAMIFLAGEVAEGWRAGGAVGYEVRMQMMVGDTSASERATVSTARNAVRALRHGAL